MSQVEGFMLSNQLSGRSGQDMAINTHRTCPTFQNLRYLYGQYTSCGRPKDLAAYALAQLCAKRPFQLASDDKSQIKWLADVELSWYPWRSGNNAYISTEYCLLQTRAFGWYSSSILLVCHGLTNMMMIKLSPSTQLLGMLGITDNIVPYYAEVT